MLRLTADRIAEVAMVGIAKVRKDISKGKLDAENLADIVRYIQGHRMLAGGLRVWDGVMGVVAEDISVGEWSETEELVIGGIMKGGKSRKQAEREVLEMRDYACTDRLGVEHMEELGL